MKRCSKILALFLSALFLLNSTACSNTKKKEMQALLEAQAEQEAIQKALEAARLEEEREKKAAEIAKLNYVLVSMSERCKEAIPNGNPEEFLADLKKVLEEEKSTQVEGDVSLLYLIDKKHNIGADYEPVHVVNLVKNDDYIINKTTLSLREDAEAALRRMAQAAKVDGIKLDVSSTYRSYETQLRTFNYWVSVDGLEEAERESARAGTSQHQLGTAIDFGNIDDSYSETEGCKWLNENSEKYGWSLSFPQGYEDVTGYRWECWHFRYIGVEACHFQKKWFSDIQQFMLEFVDAWKKAE